MKKGLLFVLSILLVAGLFISCNADVSANAGTSSKDVAYVTFDKNASKGFTPGIDPADVPEVGELYWYYQAIKASGSVHEGQKTTWTPVRAGEKGLSGTIGPFSVGEWYFALVGISSETVPTVSPNVSFELDGSTVTWTCSEEARARYIGISGIHGYTTKENVTLTPNQGNPTFIPMSLKQVNLGNSVAVVYDNLGLVDNNGISSGAKVWYEIKKGETTLVGPVEVTATSEGAATGDTEDLVIELTSDIEAITLTFNLYEDNGAGAIDNSKVVKTSSVLFLASAGDTVTLTGDIDLIEASATFDAPTDACAYYVSTSGEITFYSDLNEALNAAIDGGTVRMIKDVDLQNAVWTPVAEYTGDSYFKGVFDGNGHSILNVTIRTSNKYDSLFGKVKNATIKNLTVTGIKPEADGMYGTFLVGRADGGDVLFENISVTAETNGNGNNGLILGYATLEINSVTLKHVITNGKVNSTGAYTGGMIGGIAENCNLTIENSINNADVKNSGNSSAGGFLGVGVGGSVVTIVNSQNVGDIESVGNGQSANAGGFIGGHSGWTKNLITIKTDKTRDDYSPEKATKNIGNITAGNGAGGVVGSVWMNITIDDVENSGIITGAVAGGIVGLNEADGITMIVNNCSNNGVVASTSAAPYGGVLSYYFSEAGGVVGSIRSRSNIQIAGCSGGTSSVSATGTGEESGYVTYRGAGRLIGHVSHVITGENVTVGNMTVSIKDSANDDNSINTIGAVGVSDGGKLFTITEGTMYGTPSTLPGSKQFYDNDILFNNGSKWQKNLEDSSTLEVFEEDTTYNFKTGSPVKK